MQWSDLAAGLFLFLGALVFLIPMYALLRFPRTMSLKSALGFVLAGVGAALVLTFGFALLFSALSSIFSHLNPYDTPAFESIDGGLFLILVSLDFALAVVCTAQWLLIRARKPSTRSTT